MVGAFQIDQGSKSVWVKPCFRSHQRHKSLKWLVAMERVLKPYMGFVALFISESSPLNRSEFSCGPQRTPNHPTVLYAT